MNVTCKLEEVEDKIVELIDTLGYVDEIEFGSDEESKIVADNYKVLIPSLDLYAREGNMLVYDEDEDDWYADFSLTLIYNSKDERLYWEQDGIEVSLYNFLNATNNSKSMEEISGLECIIEIDDSNN